MSNTTTELSTVEEIVGRINGSGRDRLQGFLDLVDHCSNVDGWDWGPEWQKALDNYVGRDFKQRKSNMKKIRTTHPRMNADQLVAKYKESSVRNVYEQITGKRPHPDQKKVATSPSREEYEGAFCEAARKLMGAGASHADMAELLRQVVDKK